MGRGGQQKGGKEKKVKRLSRKKKLRQETIQKAFGADKASAEVVKEEALPDEIPLEEEVDVKEVVEKKERAFPVRTRKLKAGRYSVTQGGGKFVVVSDDVAKTMPNANFREAMLARHKRRPTEELKRLAMKKAAKC